MSLLVVKGIDVYYGAIQALRGVSLSIEAGERVAILGANGAGKTTTLRTISGLLSPRSGEILLDGEGIGGLPAYEVVSRGIAHGPEGRALFPGLTVEENLRFGYLPRLRPTGNVGGSGLEHARATLDRLRKSFPRSAQDIAKLIKRLGSLRPGMGDAEYQARLEWVFEYFPRLKERRIQHAGTLSGGEQQMLVVARALMSSPKLLIVDELSLGLAPKIVSLLFDIIREVNKAGTAVLIVEQFVHMALENTDRAYVLAKGEVVLEGRSSELMQSQDLVASYLGGQEGDEGSQVSKRGSPRSPGRSRSAGHARERMSPATGRSRIHRGPARKGRS